MQALIPIFGIVFGCLTAVAVIWMLVYKPAHHRHNRQEKDETLLMQEMYKNLSKLEERIESLETILLEHERRQRKNK